MTDGSPRDYADPVEECAKALTLEFKQRIEGHANMAFEDTGVEPPKRDVWIGYSTAVLTRLTQLGMLNENFFEAMKARKP